MFFGGRIIMLFHDFQSLENAVGFGSETYGDRVRVVTADAVDCINAVEYLFLASVDRE